VKQVSFFQIDAFTDVPFSGNPAAVCLLEEPREDRWMQEVAREMNLPETAFLQKEAGGYRLRWFTPATEVDLCGHATLASAHLLWEEKIAKPKEPLLFHTRSGTLRAEKRDWIELDFPGEPPQETAPPPALAQALEVSPIYTGKNRMDYLVEVESEALLRAIRPDFSLLASLPVRGTIVTAPSEAGLFDFVSRFFAPRCGIPEDPVTGSAHCCLGPYWGKKLNRTALTARQLSERGGVVRLRLQGDRVILCGQAVTILQGEIRR
jgi:predicted PhzF superfamily epimerase YddE/YHI9